MCSLRLLLLGSLLGPEVTATAILPRFRLAPLHPRGTGQLHRASGGSSRRVSEGLWLASVPRGLRLRRLAENAWNWRGAAARQPHWPSLYPALHWPRPLPPRYPSTLPTPVPTGLLGPPALPCLPSCSAGHGAAAQCVGNEREMVRVRFVSHRLLIGFVKPKKLRTRIPYPL